MQPLLEKQPFGYFLVLVVCLFEERKENYLLGPGWFIEPSLRHEIGVEVHVCIYGKGRLRCARSGQHSQLQMP